MKNIKLQSETLQISIYCEVILNILQEHANLSLSKIVVFSYLVKKNKYESQRLYDGRHSADLMYKSLSLLSGDFDEFSNSIGLVLKSIHILKINGLIEFEDGILKRNFKKLDTKSLYGESIFLKKAIEESRNISDKQFFKEVLCSV
ncbi:hypothetical protein [Metabacillus dongyingensis]|uniref:hypothetical protein n=1 Tax=Metabacillus dongyingensis TaxID=2874282 RepID=UPI001CBD006A|nr:hypothetical protein [Metabacillus dongyingensis]UAL54472.1 hypothetical protein K8L98_12200 [Metabacillus dongyingensis]